MSWLEEQNVPVALGGRVHLPLVVHGVGLAPVELLLPRKGLRAARGHEPHLEKKEKRQNKVSVQAIEPATRRMRGDRSTCRVTRLLGLVLRGHVGAHGRGGLLPAHVAGLE